jgi:23S rRNA (pseudouridine1915-N3)-methyltransferase
MRLLIVAVGRLKDGPETRLIAEYQRRLRWPLTVRELDARSSKGGGEAGRFREALAATMAGGG